MPPLTKERNTPVRGTEELAYPVGAGVRTWAGALVMLDAGFAVPGAARPGLVAAGRAEETVDNREGGAGDQDVLVRRGCFRFGQDGTITQGHVGGTAYVVDDQTVAATDGAGTRSAAGIIRGVEAGGVWVEIG